MPPSQCQALSLQRNNLRCWGDLSDHDLNCARKGEDGAFPTQTVRDVPGRAKTYAAIGSGDRSLKRGAGGRADDLDINQALGSPPRHAMVRGSMLARTPGAKV